MGPVPTPSSVAELVMGMLITFVIFCLIYGFLRITKLGQRSIETRIDLEHYLAIPASQSRCPDCMKTVILLQPKDFHCERSSYYICSCGYLGMVGKGRICLGGKDGQ